MDETGTSEVAPRKKKPNRTPEEMALFYQEKADEARRRITAGEIENGHPLNKKVLRLRRSALKLATELLEADYLEELQAALQNVAEQIAEDLLA